MSEADYLTRELANEDEPAERYEFSDGYIRNIGSATGTHELLVTNVVALLHYLLRKTSSRVYASNRLLYVEEGNRYFYPDAQVVEGLPVNSTYKQTRQPALLVEVISDSSDEYDHISISQQLVDSILLTILIDKCLIIRQLNIHHLCVST